MSTALTKAPRTAAGPLSAKVVTLLQDGADGADRSSAAATVTLAMVNAGWGWADYFREMTENRNRLSAYFTRRSNGKPYDEKRRNYLLARTWDKAQAYAAAHPAVASRTEAVQKIGVIRSMVPTADWTGRSGIRDRAIYLTLLDVATAHQTVTPTVSVRTLCEASSYRSAQTVANAIKSLVSRGYVEVVEGATADTPNGYLIREPRGGRDMDITISSTGVRDVVQDPPTRDVGTVLGPHAQAVLDAVSDEVPLTARAIARRAGVGRRTADKWLPLLLRDGLVRKDRSGNGWVRTAENPSVVYGPEAAEIDLLRATRHALQRKGWKEARNRP
jgi:DNA-binding transcriptional ArsR family regulator